MSTAVPASASSPDDWSGGGTDDAVAEALGPAAVRVVHGRPDDVELAALVAGIVAARAVQVPPAGHHAGHHPGAASAVGAWSDRGRLLDLPPRAGAGAWRWSASRLG